MFIPAALPTHAISGPGAPEVSATSVAAVPRPPQPTTGMVVASAYERDFAALGVDDIVIVKTPASEWLRLKVASSDAARLASTLVRPELRPPGVVVPPVRVEVLNTSGTPTNPLPLTSAQIRDAVARLDGVLSVGYERRPGRMHLVATTSSDDARVRLQSLLNPEPGAYTLEVR